MNDSPVDCQNREDDRRQILRRELGKTMWFPHSARRRDPFRLWRNIALCDVSDRRIANNPSSAGYTQYLLAFSRIIYTTTFIYNYPFFICK